MSESFEWRKLSVLNKSPTVLLGLTLGELGVCLASALIISLITSLPIYIAVQNWIAIPLTISIGMLLLFKPLCWLLGKQKKKYGDKMFGVKIRKTIQSWGLRDWNFELEKKTWSNRSTKKRY